MKGGSLGPADTLKALWGLMSDRRLDTFSRLAASNPCGVVLRMPHQRMVVTASPRAIRHVLVDNPEGYQKGIGQAEARALLGDGLLTAEGAAWKRQRAQLAPRLGARRVLEHIGELAELAATSVAELATADWRQRRLQPELGRYTLGCLAQTLGFTSPEPGPVIEALDAIQDQAMFDVTTLGVLPGFLTPVRRARLRRSQRVLERAARNTIDGFAEPPQWASVDGMTSLFLAGYETTASTLGWAVHYLSQQPRLQARLFEEAVCVLPADPAATGTEHVARLVLAAATLREAARIRPPVWLISRRALREDVVDGHRVRPGDQVVISPHAVHRQGWARPDHFEPDRFLDGGKAGRYVAFGAGPRACPGGALAETEGTLWLAHAASRLEFGLIPGRRLRARARLSQSLPDSWTVRVRSRRD